MEPIFYLYVENNVNYIKINGFTKSPSLINACARKVGLDGDNISNNPKLENAIL